MPDKKRRLVWVRALWACLLIASAFCGPPAGYAGRPAWNPPCSCGEGSGCACNGFVCSAASTCGIGCCNITRKGTCKWCSGSPGCTGVICYEEGEGGCEADQNCACASFCSNGGTKECPGVGCSGCSAYRCDTAAGCRDKCKKFSCKGVVTSCPDNRFCCQMSAAPGRCTWCCDDCEDPIIPHSCSCDECPETKAGCWDESEHSCGNLYKQCNGFMHLFACNHEAIWGCNGCCGNCLFGGC